MEPTSAPIVSRARPLLGTLVTIHAAPGPGDAMAAIDDAFQAIATVHACMSAHQAGSDLWRLAHAGPGDCVQVHPHTSAVLRLARQWQLASGGAFDAQRAARVLARKGLRPAIAGAEGGTLAGSALGAESSVHVDGPLALDLGGIAKGYAVDQAVAALRARGITDGLVNAGGDLRAFGRRAWSIEVQHPVVRPRTHRLLRLREGAIASSVRPQDGGEFVATRRRSSAWRCSTVLARDCATADAFTKWALQAPAGSVQLHAALARAGARLWRA
jgi:thiamine biosynthesis lipoprotein